MLELVAAVEAVQAAPARQDAAFQAAVADRLAGRNAQAIAGLRQVLQGQPDHVDARLNLGLALLASGQLDEAETQFNRVLEQVPTYADARIGLAQVARRRGQLDVARAEVDRARQLDPNRPDARDLYRELNGIRTRIDLDVSQSQMSGGLSDWQEQRLALTHSPSRDWTFTGSVERTERFDLEDILFDARVARRFERGHVYVGVSATPDADYRPQEALALGGSVRLHGAWEATLDTSVAHYPVGTVSSVQPGLAVDLAQGQVRLAGRWIQTWDELDISRSGFATSLVWYRNDRLRLRADYADAPESSSGLTIDVRTAGLGAEYDLTDRATVRAYALTEDRGAISRTAFSLGFGWRY